MFWEKSKPPEIVYIDELQIINAMPPNIQLQSSHNLTLKALLDLIKQLYVLFKYRRPWSSIM